MSSAQGCLAGPAALGSPRTTSGPEAPFSKQRHNTVETTKWWLEWWVIHTKVAIWIPCTFFQPETEPLNKNKQKKGTWGVCICTDNRRPDVSSSLGMNPAALEHRRTGRTQTKGSYSSAEPDMIIILRVLDWLNNREKQNLHNKHAVITPNERCPVCLGDACGL